MEQRDARVAGASLAQYVGGAAPRILYQALAVANDNGVSGSGATNFTVQ